MGFDLLSRFRKRSADDPPATESWPVLAFGKLPVYKDFISAGLADDASREFRDWLSNSFSHCWSTRDGYREAEIPLHAFLLRLPESHKMAVGALWGSHDQGGLRKFPFALFSILTPSRPAAAVLTALDYLPVFEARAREIRRKYDGEGSLAAVYQELRGATIEIPVRTPEQIRARLAVALAGPRVGPLAKALFGDDAETQWPALLSGLDAAARSSALGAAAFRLPLADDTSPLHQLQLWTVRLTRASLEGTGPSGVLYRTGGEVPCGVLFFRDVRAEDILLFHPAATPTDFVDEIPPSPRQSAPEPEAAPPAAAEAVLQVRAEGTPPIESAPPAEAALPAEVPPTTQPPPTEPPPPAEPPSAVEAPRLEPEPATGTAEAHVSAPEAPAAPTPASAPELSAPPASDGPPPAPPATPATESPPAAAPSAEPSLPPGPPGWDLPLASLLECD